MNKYFIYFLLFILFGCSEFNRLSYVSEKEKIADKIIEKTAKELLVKKGLRPCGSGGQMMDQVEMLALAFTYNKPIEIEEGRKLLVTAIETFVSTINSDEKIRPYLSHYPFEAKNVDIVIVIRNQDFSSVPPETLCLLSARNGSCRYNVNDAKTDLLKTIYRETFLEAKDKSSL
jgi:hypothetical protein